MNVKNQLNLVQPIGVREETRDHTAYPLLFSENITYGFRRNLAGLKPTALVCNLVVDHYSHAPITKRTVSQYNLHAPVNSAPGAGVNSVDGIINYI